MAFFRFVPACVLTVVVFGCSPNSGSGGTKQNNGGNGGGSGLDASLSGTGSTGNGNGGSGAGNSGLGGDRGFIQTHDSGEPLDAELKADSGCEAVKDTRPQAPNVLIVLDRSRSMYQANADGGAPLVDRWEPAVSAINALTTSLESQVRFGLLEFPSPLASRAFCGSGTLVVGPDLKTSGAIATALAGAPTTKVDGATPTAAALGLAKTALASLPGNSYVLLITDGAPNCNTALDPQVCACTSTNPQDCKGAPSMDGGPPPHPPESILCLDDTATVDAVKALAGAGVQTFVVGFDATTFETTLNQMAAAGGSTRTTFFPVSDGSDLTTAFQQISAFVTSCQFELSAAPPDDRYIGVSVDNHRVKENVGWKLVGDRTVELIGDTCKLVSDGSGTHDVLVVRECRPVLQ